MDALGELVPRLRLPRFPLGSWPSPLDRVMIGGHSFLAKREDLSAPGYAGNKIRPLERVFGHALETGATTVWATGAYGSNHALATTVHAPAASLRASAILWPQPRSITARANLRATVATAAELAFCGHIAAMPLIALAKARAPDALVMPPGAATPRFALGHAAGALELALQVAGAGLPTPRTLVLPVGSTCTTVGLLVGCALATHLKLWAAAPHIVAVRVTPWPVTSPWRILRMACTAADALARLGGPRLDLTPASLSQRLTVIGDALGRGYGHPTEAAWRAGAALLDAQTTVTRLDPGGATDAPSEAPPPLRTDTTYAGKAAGWLLDHLPALTRRGEVVFWMTKSAHPLPGPDLAREAALPPLIRRWLAWPRRP
jgi:1-aminocyclopropane-1-carboxylate deaminase/D-cysteine desulfhydrase-like pyridoxal-dependent ACC family enzyme